MRKNMNDDKSFFEKQLGFSGANSSLFPAENGSAETEIICKMNFDGCPVMERILKSTGYILCKNRHIRIFGGKNSRCKSLFDINELYKGYSVLKGVLIIADISSGGIFALNCGSDNGAALGDVLFLPGGSLIWERLGIGYEDFAEWALNASSEELVVGGWINSALHSLSLSEMDKITRGKIDILLSFQR